MKASGVFMYKGITQRDGGTFKNDKGEDVDYKSCMILTCDEIQEDGTGKERKFKFKDGQTYSRYEKEEITIDIFRLIQLAKYYNTSIDYLVGLTDEQKPYPRTKKTKE